MSRVFGTRKREFEPNLNSSGPISTTGDMANYHALRAQNMQKNRELLLSLGLDELKSFPPAAVSVPVVKAKSKPAPKAKKTEPLKRKRDDVEDAMSVDGDFKAARVDAEGRRRSSRRTASIINYNEDNSDEGDNAPGRSVTRLKERKQDPKQFGHIPGVPVGSTWDMRIQCSQDSVHAPTIAGIYGNATDGAYSIALSGGYEDDVDLGYAFTYTGAGGRDLKGTKDAPKNLRTGPQTKDQSFEHPHNKALCVSCDKKKPIRVIRGYKLKSIYGPPSGYRYDGLYVIEQYWMETGLNAHGYKVCKYAFKRLPDQPPIPERSEEDQEEDEGQDPDAGASSVKSSPPPSSAADEEPEKDEE
ncbi:E3 ubiquitin-protein ligase UHRF1; AltName: Full=Nuclear protein 95; AltName: Full=Nuclear zinc finger protein Np95; AltName: Full=Ubiquitin-like PHD and RING finger domain-containing protein 1; Short=mUhrf1; AltName: Full=Ubiquitin-like-containing PHD and RING finger domains protein 1 [Serendipita indica DSM 11827]|nr:E3 ubiquitin-protein ligase UHRF1; AltName: Full=Nuclear protein 95; AltName: Full=Nuclear zinc finger protein Np95; AltName: Full=Ubiquitin-like PHD and RING finger domain-containing protein 1; Short=mUhrf1; AltName: Full=Ubiquitin-like-containing PHD and RING finger domains protein 1 [Serendipita indica DSM 11827]